MVARRDWTRRWFDAALVGGDEIVTSLAVLAELERGNFPGREQALALFSQLPVEDITEAIAAIAEAYIAHKLMPNDPTGDAMHLAVAPYHKCDFLVTWNCQHLAIWWTPTLFSRQRLTRVALATIRRPLFAHRVGKGSSPCRRGFFSTS